MDVKLRLLSALSYYFVYDIKRNLQIELNPHDGQIRTRRNRRVYSVFNSSFKEN